MSQKQKIKVGISIGDINGIGIEVILKTLSDNRIFDICTPVIYAEKRALNYYINQLKLPKFNFHVLKKTEDIVDRRINVVRAWDEEVVIKPGTLSKEGGQYAIKSLNAACEAVKKNEVDVLLTAPINKENMKSNLFSFAGHTEYLHSLFGKDHTMMILMNEELRVGLVTGHISLSEVSATITSDKIERSLESLHKTLLNDFLIAKPKIAVLGLNPHAGDNGLLGTEEKDIIIPSIEKYKNKNRLIFGPFSSDGFFGAKQYLHYDAVLAMYHDQGLLPFKTLSFDQGVNFTAGLRIVRTSPSHGTAFEIAGMNSANSTSFMNALYTGINIFRNRSFDKKSKKTH